MSDFYKQAKGLIFRQEEDEAIIFNPENSDILVVNSTGCFIWPMLNGKNTKGAIVSKVTKEFDVTKEKACKDLEAFLSDLENRNFIKKQQ